MAVDIWTYRHEITGIDLSGFEVEATDGKVGKVDEASYGPAAGSLIVDTGPWILGKKVMLPAGTIERIDYENKRIYVDRAKEEIKNAPEYDPSGYSEQEYRIALEEYYSPFYR